MWNIQKNATHLQKCVSVRICVRVRKMGHSYKYVSQLEYMPGLENQVRTIKMAKAHLEKCFTVRFKVQGSFISHYLYKVNMERKVQLQHMITR